MTSVLLTQRSGSADGLVVALERRGIRVHAVPAIALAPVGDPRPIDEAMAELAEVDWLVITSAAAAGVLAERSVRRPASGRFRIAAVGEATAASLAAIGLPPDFVPREAGGAALAAELAARGPLRGSRVVLLRSDIAGGDLPDGLRLAGASLRDVVAYRTIEAPSRSREPLRRALDDLALAALVVASGSAIRGVLRLAGDGRRGRLRALTCIAIGPRTADEARAAGFLSVVVASSPAVDAVAKTVVHALSGGHEAVPA